MCDHEFYWIGNDNLRCIKCATQLSLDQISKYVKVKAIYEDSAMADVCGELKATNEELERDIDVLRVYILKLESALGPTAVKRLMRK